MPIRMNGFAIGSSTNPCTKGIWIWNKPVRLNETTDMIILDTEGLHSVCMMPLIQIYKNKYAFFSDEIERDESVDVKIFVISVLLASMLVYNNIGHIDELAI